MQFPGIILLLVFLSNARTATGQSVITVKATIDKNKILIGEPIQLTLEAVVPGRESSRFFIIDSLAHFELLEHSKIDSVRKNTGMVLKQTFRITSFDSGHWVIPSFALNRRIKTDTLAVDVVFSPFDPGQDYHDIKDIIEINTPAPKTQWWYAAGGALLLLLLLIWWLRKNKATRAVPAEQTVNPYEEAMRQLETLKTAKPAPKQFYSELANIFRLYIFRKKGIRTLQKTTDDLVSQLGSLNLEKEQLEQLFQSLGLSDSVKFAKYIPTTEDNRFVFDTLRDSIMNIEESESENLPTGRI